MWTASDIRGRKVYDKADGCAYGWRNSGGGEYAMANKQDARRALAMAMVAIGRSSEPQQTFESYEALIGAALGVLGREFDTTAFLSACGVAAATGPAADACAHEFPQDAFDALCQVRSDVVEIVQWIGDAEDGLEFEYRCAEGVEEGFAIYFSGRWVIAPGALGREDLEAVDRAFRRHFDLFIAMTLNARGVDDGCIAEMRDHLGPARALLLHERDPKGHCDTFPLVFAMANPTPLARRFFCALNPLTGETSPYDTDDSV